MYSIATSSLNPISMSGLIAHQGGWDEILLVAAPMAAIVVLLGIVKRRLDSHQAPTDDSRPTSST